MQDKEHTNDDTSNRRGRSPRAAFLIDGENYFRAVAEAVRKAERSVLLVGWDIDSRLLLERDPDGPRLYELLNDLAKERPDVHVHILIWDYPLAYSMDREPLQMISFARKTPKNVHFHLDSEFPMGSSHHQKIVTVDDKVAFSGGMDLSSGRWDTMEHLPDDDRRTAPNGEKYTPYHDVQMVLDGEPAKALADIARERWLWATGHCLTPPEKTEGDPWPDSVTPDMHDEEITVSLTIPKYKKRAEVREIERMYLREIGKADSRIYMENQYFTSKPIKEALASRLREPDGPEVVIILPHTPTGLVERLVMEPLQSEVLDSLHESDEYDRLEVYCPFSDEDGNSPVKVHAKVMIIDDEFATVGSANLNNRSMGLDTECNLDFRPVRSKGALTNFRRKLLAHHLGISPERLEEEERSGCTMANALRNFATRPKGSAPNWKRETVPRYRWTRSSPDHSIRHSPEHSTQ
jgi:phosphatidylserine/phosphatidylglycerophosphate/cardiolipin synthase-like enzyme